MDDFDPAELERIRRYGRPDWRRLWPPGWERGLNPAQIEAQRKEFAKWERAFETPLARRLRKEAEERAQIEQERLQAEIEREVLAMKAEVASMRLELTLAEIRWKAECAERKRQADIAWERFMAAFKRGDFRRKANFDPDQPRDELGDGPMRAERAMRVAAQTTRRPRAMTLQTSQMKTRCLNRCRTGRIGC